MKPVLLYLYIGLTIVLISALWPESFQLNHTPIALWVSTAIVTLCATFAALLPAYLSAAVVTGFYHAPLFQRCALLILYLLAGMPSIIIGVAGFITFSYGLGLGWSMLSAILTLVFLLAPTLATAFIQLLNQAHSDHYALARGLDMSRTYFLFIWLPTLKKEALVDTLLLGWSRALGDTAAIMLTCGAVMATPTSLLDPVRLINYHIYLLAMEVPGGFTEAQSIALLQIIMIALLFIPRWLLQKREPCLSN